MADGADVQIPPTSKDGGDRGPDAPAIAPVEFGGVTYKPLADGKYDGACAPLLITARLASHTAPHPPHTTTYSLPAPVIIMGTGLKESILSGLLSVKGMKVLHIDRNSYYGGECASLNLTNLYKKFMGEDKEPPPKFFEMLGANRDYNVDLVPKFLMANGNLVKVLVHTDVTRYLEFKLIDGSYCYKKGLGVCKVPATEGEAIGTKLLGLLQKNWLRSFLKYIAKYDQANPATWDKMDLSKATMAELYAKAWLDADAQEFIGHAMGLAPDDGYLQRPALECVKALRLYAESLDRYGKSPFIYPIYGLGGLPEGFSRLCAIHGGIFILNKGVDEVLLNPDGTAAGVRSGSGADAEVALAPIVIGDPSYFKEDMVRVTGRVIRTICILNKPVPGLEAGTDSGQIILPQKQVGRKNGASTAGPPPRPPLLFFCTRAPTSVPPPPCPQPPYIHPSTRPPSPTQTSTSPWWATRTRWWGRASTAPSCPPRWRRRSPRRRWRRGWRCCPRSPASRASTTSRTARSPRRTGARAACSSPRRTTPPPTSRRPPPRCSPCTSASRARRWTCPRPRTRWRRSRGARGVGGGRRHPS